MSVDEQLRKIVQRSVEEHETANQFCKEVGIPQSSLSQWLCGARKNMGWHTIAKICDYLGVELVVKKKGRKKK